MCHCSSTGCRLVLQQLLVVLSLVTCSFFGCLSWTPMIAAALLESVYVWWHPLFAVACITVSEAWWCCKPGAWPAVELARLCMKGMQTDT